MFLEIVMTLLGGVLLVIAFAGCIVPVIPGPILAVGAMVLLSVPAGFTLFSWPVLAGAAAAAVFAQVMDNILPARAAGKAGAGRGGIIGSVLGMVVGSIFFPPFGVFVGAFLGAFLGELLFHRENRRPLVSALAVFRGTIGAIILKLAVTGGITVLYVQGALRLFGA